MLKLHIQQTSPNPIQLQLECAPGELHALVGPSGSGKTSTLRLIAGLQKPQGGYIEWAGQDWFNTDSKRGALLSQSPAQRSCGFLFQQYALFPHLNALDNVLIALYNSPHSEAQRRIAAKQWLDKMGIGDLAQRLPAELSGGQQQRLGLARALAKEPGLLLLDEPFSAIDTPTRQQLYQTLAEIRQQMGISIILVTHDLREANLLADRITVIDQGISLQTAKPEHLFKKPRNARVAELVGIPNIYRGVFNQGRLQWANTSFSFGVVDKGKIPPETEVAWVIPQEGIALDTHHSSDDAFTPIPIEVRRISALGQIAVVQMTIIGTDQEMTWQASSSEIKRLQLNAGIKATLKLDCQQIHIMPLRPINDPRLFKQTAL